MLSLNIYYISSLHLILNLPTMRKGELHPLFCLKQSNLWFESKFPIAQNTVIGHFSKQAKIATNSFCHLIPFSAFLFFLSLCFFTYWLEQSSEPKRGAAPEVKLELKAKPKIGSRTWKHYQRHKGPKGWVFLVKWKVKWKRCQIITGISIESEQKRVHGFLWQIKTGCSSITALCTVATSNICQWCKRRLFL